MHLAYKAGRGGGGGWDGRKSDASNEHRNATWQRQVERQQQQQEQRRAQSGAGKNVL